MYETNDSYFLIFDTPFLVIAGTVIVLAIAGVFFFKTKGRKNREG